VRVELQRLVDCFEGLDGSEQQPAHLGQQAPGLQFVLFEQLREDRVRPGQRVVSGDEQRAGVVQSVEAQLADRAGCRVEDRQDADGQQHCAQVAHRQTHFDESVHVHEREL